MGIIWYQVSCFGATYRITVLNYQPKRPASWNSSRYDLKLDVLCNFRVGSPGPCLSRKTHWIDCAYDCFCCLITSQLCIYPLVMTHIAIEYGHLQCVFRSNIVIFHSYASFLRVSTDRTSMNIHLFWTLMMRRVISETEFFVHLVIPFRILPPCGSYHSPAGAPNEASGNVGAAICAHSRTCTDVIIHANW